MPATAVVLDDWHTLRRATEPGAIRTHLAASMHAAGILHDVDLFQDAFDYASAFHRTMTERDLREHTIEQVLSLAMYTLGSPIPPTEPSLGHAKEDALTRNADQVQWYEDVLPLLKDLKAKGVPLALVSNTIFGFGDPWEDRMAEWFPTRVLSREFGYVKPHPGIFLEAARGLGVDPHECVFVGDLLLSDVWGAQRVGMAGVLLDRGDVDQNMFRSNDAHLAANLGVKLEDVKPKATIASLDAVPAMLG